MRRVESKSSGMGAITDDQARYLLNLQIPAPGAIGWQ